MDPLTIASLGVQGVSGLVSTISGLFQKAKANRLAKLNVRPLYEIPGEIKANQAIAQQQARQGMPGAQYAAQSQAIARGANSAMANAQDRRGGLAAIGTIQQGVNDASLNLNAQDASMRMGNIRNLMQQNAVLAQFKDKQFAWNKQAKFQENAAAIRALNGAGNANLNTGFNALGSMGVTALAEQYGDTTGGTTPSATPSQMAAYRSFRNRGW